MAAFTIVDILDLLKTQGHSENTGLSQVSPGYKYFTITDLFAQDYVMKHREGNGIHSSTLAWKIPWTEEPGGLQSMGSLRVGHD